jgi:molybdopterin-guanine dinucleotide biosynthesis protein A
MNKNSIMGGILAGGLSRRMGGADKSLVQLNNQTLISRVSTRLFKQVGSMVINANGDPNIYDELHYPVVCDIIQGFAGPLAGIHALMSFAKSHDSNITHIASVAADTPFFPIDFVDHCIATLKDEKHPENTIVLAKSGDNRHPVFGLWPVNLCDDLELFLSAAETRKVMAFVQQHSLQYAEFPIYELDGITIDPFFNINRPDDLIEAAAIFEKLKPAE